MALLRRARAFTQGAGEIVTALPLPGPTKAECGGNRERCNAPGCPLFGSTLRKTFRDGLPRVRGCGDPAARGSRAPKNAGSRERKTARRIGGERAPLSGALSGYDIRVYLRGGVPLYIEETTNRTVCRGIESWWASKNITGKTRRLLALRGGLRALVLPGLVVMPRVDWEQLVQLAGEDDT